MELSQKQKYILYIAGAIMAAAALVVLIRGSKAPPQPPLNVLFIGNSYTSANALPTIFQEMAASAGYPKPVVESYTPGGRTFQGHLADASLMTVVASKKWDVVVLQEQSEVPVIAQGDVSVNESFLNGGRGLYKLVRGFSPQARVVLFETWARHQHWWDKGINDTSGIGRDRTDMQERLKAGYEEVARTMVEPGEPPAEIARVGELWEANYRSPSSLQLHDSDDSHPNYAGSYLAALDLFSTIYRTSPQRVKFTGSLDDRRIGILKDLVARILFPGAK